MASVAVVARRLHHGAIALVFAGVVLLMLAIPSGLVLMGAVALLDAIGTHMPMEYFGVFALMVGLLDVGVAAWAAAWGYRLMRRPLEQPAAAA